MLDELQKKAAEAIVNIFETDKILGDYCCVVCLQGDPGGLTYGRSQTTLNSGNLFLLIKAYCQSDGAISADVLQPYLPRLNNRDQSLDHDSNLRQLLRSAGKDPVMQKTQDEFFDRVYWNPAVKSATNLGINTPLGTAVVYDSVIHGSWQLMRDRTLGHYGTVANLGEKDWIKHYVDVRRDWLANHSIVILHGTVYRMDAFKSLITSGNWDLNLPFIVRGHHIDQQSLTPAGKGSAIVTEMRLLKLRQPYMTGDDVRLVQEALNSKGFALDPDGIYGLNTEKAVRAFQKQQGNLVVDGIVGNATRAALDID